MGYHWNTVLLSTLGNYVWSTSESSTGMWEAGHLPTILILHQLRVAYSGARENTQAKSKSNADT